MKLFLRKKKGIKETTRKQIYPYLCQLFKFRNNSLYLFRLKNKKEKERKCASLEEGDQRFKA